MSHFPLRCPFCGGSVSMAGPCYQCVEKSPVEKSTPVPQVQLPRWQSHKKVWGDKIIKQDGDLKTDYWILACGAVVAVSLALLARVPKEFDPVGGYYVRYEDGYESWSPARAFEEGYTRLEEA